MSIIVILVGGVVAVGITIGVIALVVAQRSD